LIFGLTDLMGRDPSEGEITREKITEEKEQAEPSLCSAFNRGLPHKRREHPAIIAVIILEYT
jgi:hypothetical protein